MNNYKMNILERGRPTCLDFNPMMLEDPVIFALARLSYGLDICSQMKPEPDWFGPLENITRFAIINKIVGGNDFRRYLIESVEPCKPPEGFIHPHPMSFNHVNMRGLWQELVGACNGSFRYIEQSDSHDCAE